MTIRSRAAIAAAVSMALLMLTAAAQPARAEEQPRSQAEQTCLNGYNSCRSPCFGKRTPGPCLASCRATYNICKGQAR